MKLNQLSQRQRLPLNPFEYHDHHELELPGTWEPLGSSGTYRFGKKKRTHILFLMETKLKVSEMQSVKTDLEFPSMLVVPSVKRSGELALLWKN